MKLEIVIDMPPAHDNQQSLYAAIDVLRPHIRSENFKARWIPEGSDEENMRKCMENRSPISAMKLFRDNYNAKNLNFEEIKALWEQVQGHPIDLPKAY